ncbi:MAG TPA: 3-phosphoshikimate 1-carboxyvinyltransferase [Caulobacterales bacterium]|nr:3-phosphoshikimate 1-carboxyvinyltransferase [Caulobacterales bacterium]
MRLKARAGGPLRGRARPPGDKSISHRSLILGALAQGTTEVEGLLEADDVLRTADAVRALGADARRLGPGRWTVEGAGGFGQPAGPIDCGNSGTGARLLIGAAAGYPISARFDGDGSLRKRPMNRVITPLSQMGARFEAADGRLPLTVMGGGLKGVTYRSPVASAQIKSAVLLAGLQADGETVLIEPERSRDHSERMLRAFGANIDTVEIDGAAHPRVRRSTLRAAPVSVPADPSSAAFPIVAALLVAGAEARVDDMLMNPLRIGLVHTLRDMGADITLANPRELAGEPISDLVVRASLLKATAPPPERVPSMIDEYPILAVAAAFAEGETRLTGAAELRVKESDRIALTVAGLRACGVDAEELPDGLIVRGAGPRGVKGGAEIRTEGDHRIAMSFLVLGLAAQNPVIVDEAEMIATSFPGFVALMRGLGAEIAED